MQRSGTIARARRRAWSVGVAVGATVAVLASPLAVGTASADTSTISVTSVTPASIPYGGSTVIDYSVTTASNTASSVSIVMVGGPDLPQGTIGTVCTTGAVTTNAATGSCTLTSKYAGTNGATDTFHLLSNGHTSSPDDTVALTGAPATDSGVAVTPATDDQPVGGTATLNVTFNHGGSANVAPVYYRVLSGPDGPTATNHTQATPQPCTTKLNGTATCVVSSLNGSGRDTVQVFADNDGSGTFNSGDAPASSTPVITFAGPIASLVISPTTSTSTTGTCQVYSVHATDGANQTGNNAGNQTVYLTAASSATTPTFSWFTVSNGTCGNSAVATGATHSAMTGVDGTLQFGLSTDKPGSGTVKAGNTSSATPPVVAQAAATWVAGGDDAVAGLQVSPSLVTDYVGSTAHFSVIATDSGGHVIQGATVYEEATSGPATSPSLNPSAGGFPVACGATNQSGKVTCAVTNAGGSSNTGTDALTFWVNKSSPPSGCTSLSQGPDTSASCDEATAAALATFDALPPAGTTLVVSCPDQTSPALATSPNCIVPAGQQVVTFAATVKTSAGVPESGIVVTYTTSGTGTGANPPTTTPVSGSATTGSDGVAAIPITNTTAADGDTVTVTAQIGDPAHGGFGPAHAAAAWQARAISAMTLTPSLQTVNPGAIVSVVAKVVDQFGQAASTSKTLIYTVSGRNGISSSTTTGSGGTATISYTDNANAAGSKDTITVDESPEGLTATAEVDYVTGPTTAGSVVVDTSGSSIDVVAAAAPQPRTASNCNASGHTATTGVDMPGEASTPAGKSQPTTVCAVVTNSSNQPLAGRSVTFTVSNGQVGAVGSFPSTTNTTTYVATTASNGVAVAEVESTHSGVQTVTASADAATDSNTVTYNAPAVKWAYRIAAAPTPVTVTHGGSQKFTFTVTDQYGNGVPGVTAGLSQSGPGILTAGSGAQTTDADGQVSALLSTQATDSGTGTVTGTIPTSGTQCATTGGVCHVAASYTVAAPTISVVAAPGGKVAKLEFVGATVKNADGSPATGQVVVFTVSGANSVSGSAPTNSKGVAVFAYTPTHSGTDRVVAVDSAFALQGSTTTTIAAVHEKPTIRLTAKVGRITIHVTTHPSLANDLVTYYVKRNGGYRRIGTSRTGPAGKAVRTFREPSGVRMRFRVKAAGRHGITSGTSKSKVVAAK